MTKKILSLEEELKNVDQTVEQIKKEEYINVCDKKYEELLPRLNYIKEQLKRDKHQGSLIDIVTSIEELVNQYEKFIPEPKEVEKYKLPKEIAKKIEKGIYTHWDFIFDIYGENPIPQEVIKQKYLDLKKSLVYTALCGRAGKELKKNEKQAKQQKKPSKLQHHQNGRDLYVDCHGGVHTNHDEAVEANQAYHKEKPLRR